MKTKCLIIYKNIFNNYIINVSHYTRVLFFFFNKLLYRCVVLISVFMFVFLCLWHGPVLHDDCYTPLNQDVNNFFWCRWDLKL